MAKRRKTWVVVPNSPLDRLLTVLELIGKGVAVGLFLTLCLLVAGWADGGCGGWC